MHADITELRGRPDDQILAGPAQMNHKDGTGKLARIEGVDIYGKTGTAQNPHGEAHSWFAGYMTIDNDPVISLSVLVENGGKGSIEGAIISRKIFEFILQNELIQ